MILADGHPATDQDPRKRFMLFVLVGGIAAVVNVLSRIALDSVVSYEVSIVPAYLCGMTTAYVLNKMFVFKRSGRRVSEEYLRFALVNVGAGAQVWIVSVGFARYIFPEIGFQWHAETVAHVSGVIVPAFTSYMGHKHFTFSATRHPPTNRI